MDRLTKKLTNKKWLNSRWDKAWADRQMLITVLQQQQLYIRRTQTHGCEFLADRKRHQVWIRRNSKWICSHALLKASLIAFAFDFWDACCEHTNPSIRWETIISERFPLWAAESRSRPFKLFLQPTNHATLCPTGPPFHLTKPAAESRFSSELLARWRRVISTLITGPLLRTDSAGRRRRHRCSCLWSPAALGKH